jgi:hypothetical protein
VSQRVAELFYLVPPLLSLSHLPSVGQKYWTSRNLAFDTVLGIEQEGISLHQYLVQTPSKNQHFFQNNFA